MVGHCWITSSVSDKVTRSNVLLVGTKEAVLAISAEMLADLEVRNAVQIVSSLDETWYFGSTMQGINFRAFYMNLMGALDTSLEEKRAHMQQGCSFERLCSHELRLECTFIHMCSAMRMMWMGKLPGTMAPAVLLDSMLTIMQVSYTNPKMPSIP